MSETHILKDILKNDRFFLPLISIYILSLVLVFYKDSCESFRNNFVSAYVVYVTGAALIAQIQNMLGNRKRIREGTDIETTIETWKFSTVLIAHIAWFSLFVYYLLHGS